MTMHLPRMLGAAVLSTSLLVASAGNAQVADPVRSRANVIALETTPAKPLIRKPNVALTQDVAILRKRQIVKPTYRLDVSLNEDGKPFDGTVTINFDLVPQGSPVTIDFLRGEVLSLRINGKEAAIDYNKYFLSIPEAQLKKGANEVVIQFRHPYSEDGLGLYYFKDPLDKKVYTYSQFELYNANRVFPLFDQPNLKATFTLNIEAPAHWTVVSNMAETAIDKKGNRSLWRFPKTPLMSSYLLAIHAGEYAIFDLGKHKGIPMRLLSRVSLKDSVPVKEWDTATRQGLDFFTQYFGIPYSFGKYDQLVVPDFYYGGMENIGAVTFVETCCTPGKKSLATKVDSIGIIFHELGHMWFGNLVTMDWWNDLWLNESFTELMTTTAMDAGSDVKTPWLEYFWNRKAGGYIADDSVTTHPIVAKAPDTTIAFALVDGITYAKGGSALRQLRYYLGPDKFRLGIQNYMKKYAYGNTTLADLLKELSLASGQDSSTWSKEWLETTGTNRVTPEITCKAGKIQSLTLQQTPGIDGKQLRTHKLQVALYPQTTGKLAAPKVLDALLVGAKTDLTAARGLPCPALVLPNYGDYGFIQVLLDQTSKETIKAHLLDIADPLTRALLWEAARQGVFDGRYPLTDYADLVLRHLPQEPNAYNMSGVISRQNFFAPVLNLSQDNPHIAAWQQDYNTQLANLAATKLTSVEPGSEAFLDWLSLYKLTAQSPEQLNTIKGWLTANQAFGWKLDQSQRWGLINLLATIADPDAQPLLAKEIAADASSQGQQAALSIRSLLADRTQKLQLIQEAIDPKRQQSLSNRKAIIGGALERRQAAAFKQNAQPVLALFLDKAPTMDQGLAAYIATGMVPSLYTCSAEWNTVVDQYLKQPKQLTPDLIKGLRQSKQSNGRCLTVQQRLAERLNETKPSAK
ncbi:MAG: aminopeptidase N [Leptolyngbya sp. BL-A-14]